MATKTEPGRTRRESYSMPVIGSVRVAARAFGGYFFAQFFPVHLGFYCSLRRLDKLKLEWTFNFGP